MKNPKCLLVMNEGTLWTFKGRKKYLLTKLFCFYQWWPSKVKSLWSEMGQFMLKQGEEKCHNELTVYTCVLWLCCGLVSRSCTAQSSSNTKLLLSMKNWFQYGQSLCIGSNIVRTHNISLCCWHCCGRFVSYLACQTSTDLLIGLQDEFWINPFLKKSRFHRHRNLNVSAWFTITFARNRKWRVWPSQMCYIGPEKKGYIYSISLFIGYSYVNTIKYTISIQGSLL